MGKRKSRKKTKALAKAWCHKHIIVDHVIYPGNITAVSAHVHLDGGTGPKVYGEGGSKCNPIDVYDRERGFVIALGRAATNIAVLLVEEGIAPWKEA